jgi:ABC-type multidrug transport system permease subunit
MKQAQLVLSAVAVVAAVAIALFSKLKLPALSGRQIAWVIPSVLGAAAIVSFALFLIAGFTATNEEIANGTYDALKVFCASIFILLSSIFYSILKWLLPRCKTTLSSPSPDRS